MNGNDIYATIGMGVLVVAMVLATIYGFWLEWFELPRERAKKSAEEQEAQAKHRNWLLGLQEAKRQEELRQLAEEQRIADSQRGSAMIYSTYFQYELSRLSAVPRRSLIEQTVGDLLESRGYSRTSVPPELCNELVGTWLKVWKPHALDPLLGTSNEDKDSRWKVGSASYGTVFVSKKEFSTHMQFIGRTGCGKTNLILQFIAHCIKMLWTVVVLDLRGELVDRILARLLLDANGALDDLDQWAMDTFRMELAKRLCLVDLRGDSENVVGLNPLVGPAGPYVCAFQTLDLFRGQYEKLGPLTEQVLRNCLLALAQAKLTLCEIGPLLSDDAFRARVLREVSDENVLAFFAEYDGLRPEQRRQWTAPILNRVLPYTALPVLNRALGAPNVLDWQKLLDRRPGSVVLCALGGNQWGSASGLIGSAIVNAIKNVVLSRPDVTNHPPAPVYFTIDEFENFVSDGFQTFLSESRKFGCSLCLAHQGLQQLTTDLKESVEINCLTRLLFATGSSDSTRLVPEIQGATENPRHDLMNLATGEAFLVSRPRPTTRIRTAFYQEPIVPTKHIAFLRRCSDEQYAMPSGKVDEIIANRARTEITPSGTTLAFGKEVRHGKRPNL